ncbi:hypothetical protein GTA08_BOTSDO02298 [Neofusicoccum parvum]|uniref:Uncharacterized protein n=1 Tax=Neofusicoccum parvum TaxID=310453 RepID=A0ACB5SB90_9PEZI|nr:hypothetical protein GTA08_BOTSDO02298 [Neofusicoccum parvum]
MPQPPSPRPSPRPRCTPCLRPPRRTGRLLDLPAELRQLILAFALRDPDGVTVDDDRRMHSASLPTLAALLLVSRAVHAEALAVFASANAFTVDNGGGLLSLLRAVGAPARPQLRHATVVFARPTGRGFVDGAALKDALDLLLADCPRARVAVELALRAAHAPFNHAHADEREPCACFPRAAATNRAGRNFWIHPASVADTPHADQLRRLVRRAAAVRWAGSPAYSFSSACDDSMAFVRQSEEWLRPRGEPGFEGYACEWESAAADVAPRPAREKP